ncbi:MAG: hypothetical protein Tsb0019_28690 [Roseibium sp.]
MKKRFSRLSAAAFLFIAGSGLPGKASALDCKFCEGKSPKDLIELSVSMKSNALRAQIRGWLAEKHPETAAGLTGRAWVLSSNGGAGEDVVALYLKALEKDPTIDTPYVNGGIAYRSLGRHEDAIALYRKGLAAGHKDPIFLQNIYFGFRNGLKDAAAAENFLKEAEREGYSYPWAVDFVRGLGLQGSDRQRANDFYKSALDKGGDETVLSYWMNNRLRLLAARRADQNQRLDVLRTAIDWARRNDSARAYFLVAQKLETEFKNYGAALDYYEKSYDTQPTPDAAAMGFAAGGNYQFDRAIALLERGSRDFPDNHEILTRLTWAYSTFALDEEKAREYGPKAVAAGPRNSDIRNAIAFYADFLEDVGSYEEAVPLFEAHLPQMKGRDYDNLLKLFIDNRVMAGAYDRAARLIRDAEGRDGISDSWLAVRRNRVAMGLRLAGERERYLAENPFLNDWEQRFGESLQVKVEFETGKAEIRPESFPVLDKAAAALQGEGADNYVFLVEGHTDSRGSDEINMPLSQARAASVERYLVEQGGLEDERIQTAGYGPRTPVATNETEDGRQRNRRVEIRPFGNISAPKIATNGWLNASAVRLSSDGRTAVTGDTPTQVWDLTRMVRLHELPMGGPIREISPNGRYLAARSAFEDTTGTLTHMIYVYDLRTGLVRNQIPAEIYVNNLLWSPFSDEIAWTDQAGFLRVFSLTENRIRSARKIDTIRGSSRLLWLNDGSRIIARSTKEFPVQIMDAATLETVATLPDTGWVHEFGQTFDGSRVAASTNSGDLIVWDSKSWQEVLRRPMPISGFYMRSHPSRPWIMLSGGFDTAMKLALVDLTDGNILGTYDADTEIRGSFTADGSQYAFGRDGGIAYLDLKTMKPVRSVSGQSVAGRSLTMVPGAKAVISQDLKGASVWSLETGRRLHRFDVPTAYGWHPVQEGGQRFFSVTREGEVVSLDTETFTHEMVLETGLRIRSLEYNDDVIVLGGVPSGQSSYREPQATLIVLDRRTLTEKRRFTTPVVTEPTRFSDIFDPSVRVRVAENGLVAFTSLWTAGVKQARTSSALVTIFDSATGQEVSSFRSEGPHSDLTFEEGGKELWFKDKSQWYVHDTQTGKILRREAPKPDYEIEMSDGRTIHWFWDHVRLEEKEITFPYTLRDLELNEALNLAVGITTGNEIVFIDLKHMKLALTIAAKDNGEWLAYAPDGSFSSSLGGTEGVYWSLGDNYVPFEGLRERFEQPGLIRKRLEAIASGNGVSENDTPDVAPDVFEAPYKVTLKSPETSTTEAETFLLELSVEKDSTSVPDPEIEYVLNGRKVLKSRGFDEEAVFDGDETLGISRRFDLLPGRNVIEASLVWRDARIMTRTLEVTRSSKADVEQAVAGQALWFFGVGVSDYEISSQNLNFAHRDAEELARLMQQQEGRLFDKVNTKILTNEEATERNVRIEMNEFLGKAAPDDVIVVFIAGHGVTDEEQELYYMTHDADMSKPYTGMAVDRFRQYLENRPINQRALFLLDICHSGAAEGRVVADDAVQSLTAGTGAVVFASSSGSQKSFEDEAFGGGHGAFTAAILAGLSGPADQTVGNRDGLNSLQEMIVFTTSEVPKLTQGRQRPTLPGMDNSVDYALTRAE